MFLSCGIPNLETNSNAQRIEVPINIDCVDKRKLLHSLARLLGLPDEHTRPDRDKFLTIHWDNLQRKIDLISELLKIVACPYELYLKTITIHTIITNLCQRHFRILPT